MSSDTEKLIQDLTIFFIKENYKKYLEDNKLKFIPDNKINITVNNIYTDKKKKIKRFS